jgi:hypothetical protein
MELPIPGWAFRFADPLFQRFVRLAKTAPALVSRGSHGSPIGFNDLTHLRAYRTLTVGAVFTVIPGRDMQA